jgi:hypothetical protein
MSSASPEPETVAKNGEESQGNSAKTKVPRPTRALPTNRVATGKQYDILRAFGAVSGPDGNAVTNVEVSKIVELHQSTVGLVTPFLADIGLLTKTNDGLVPVQEVQDYAASYEWNPESAFQRVAPVLKRTWFFERLLPKLRFSALPRDKALTELAMASNAAPSFRGQLETLLEYLAEAGLIADDGGQIRLLQSSEASNGGSDMDDQKPTTTTVQVAQDYQRSQPVATMFSSPAAGVVKFNISVNVDMTEFAGWSPERITAFFAGVAQVLAAKGSIEKKAAASTPLEPARVEDI